jgi:TP901 family phage tail tape measure protein
MNIEIILQAVNEATPALSGLENILSQIQKQAEELSTTFSNLAKTLDSSMSTTSKAVEELSTPLSNETSKVESLTGAFNELSKSAETDMASTIKAAGELSTPLAEDSKEVDSLTTAFNDLAKSAETDMANVAKTAESIAKPISEDETAVNNLAESIAKLGRDAEASATQAKEAIARIGKGKGGGLVPVTKEEEEEEGQPGSGGKGGGRYSNNMNTLFGGVSMKMAAAPMISGFEESISTFKDFDQAIANVNSMMGYSDKQIEGVKNQLLELSKTAPASPKELAEGLYAILGAGVDAADSMDVLKTAAKGAVAGNTDMETSTKSLIYVMDAYGLSAKEAPKISDMMFAGNKSSAATFGELARSLGTVIGPAAQVGVGFDQLMSATAALTNQGLSARRATMGLRALLLGIAAPTEKAKKTAQELGIQWDESALKQKGIVGMMQEAMKATGGNSEELKKLMPNLAAWTVAVDLGGKGAESYKTAMDVMASSSGSTDKALQKQSEGFEIKMKHMTNALDRAKIAFTTSFAPALEKIMGQIVKLSDSFCKLDPTTKKTIAYVLAGVAAFLAIAGAAMLFIAGIGQVMMGLDAFAKMFGAESFGAIFTKAWQFVAIFAKNIAMYIGEAVTAIAAFFGLPVAVVVAIIAAVVILGVFIYKYWDEIKAFFAKTWDEIKKVATSSWDGIKKFFSDTWDSIKKNTKEVWEDIANFFTKTIPDEFQKFEDSVKKFFTDTVPKKFDEFKDYLWDLFTVKIPYCVGYAIGATIKFFEDLPGTVWDWLTKLGEKISTFATNVWTEAKKVGKNIFDGIIDFVKAAPGEVYNWIMGKGGLVEEISNTAAEVYEGAKEIGTKVVSGIIDFVMTAPGKVVDWITGPQGIIQKIKDTATDIYKAASDLGGNILNGIVNAVTALPGKILDIARGALTSVVSFFTGVKDTATTVANNFSSGVSAGMGNVPKHGDGGFFDTPHLAIVGDEPEWIIPQSKMNGLAVAGAGSYGGSTTFNISVTGNIARNEQELGEIVAKAVWKQAKMQGKF